MCEAKPAKSLSRTRMVGKVSLEVPATFPDEMVPNVGCAARCRASLGRLAGALDGPQGNSQLTFSRGVCQLLHRLSVPVPTEEIHAGVHIRRVALQHLLNETDRFEILAPVQGGTQTKTGNHISDRELSRCLPLVLSSHRIFRREVVAR